MRPSDIAEAARLLIGARQDERLSERLPLGSRAVTVEEAEAIQRAVAAGLRQDIAGWKVALSDQYGVMRGTILSSRLFPSDAMIPINTPSVGVEAEIAFRCDVDLLPRSEEYRRSEIEESVTALVGIEFVASRFSDPMSIPVIERASDAMSNGGFIAGTVRVDWRRFNLENLPASVLVNGQTVVDRKVGALAPKDPVVPMLALANALRTTTGLLKGQIVTTGTYTGVTPCGPGDTVEVVFEDFGRARVEFTR